MPSNPLLHVPLELLLDIVSLLSVEDQGRVRLVCKSLEASIFDSFTQRFFSEKTILQTEPSLATLLEISRSRMSAYLKRIVVQAHLIRPDCASSAFAQDGEYPGSNVDLWTSCLNMSLLDQQAFIAMGRDIEMLGVVFANLHRLDGVRVVGAPGEDPDVNSSCVAHVLYALGKAGSTPRVFELYEESYGFQDLAFHVPDSMLDIVRPALAHVESLSIDLCLNPSFQMAPLMDGRMSNLNKADALSRFLRHFESLKSLRLDSYGCRDMGSFLMWVAAPAHLDPQHGQVPIGKSDLVQRHGQYTASELPLRELAGPAYLPRLLQLCRPIPTVCFQHLEELDLVNTHAGRQPIMQLLRKFQPSLHTLRLSSVLIFDEMTPVAWPETEVKSMWSGLTDSYYLPT